MPWGKKSTDHNTKGLTAKQKKTVAGIQRDVNQEAKRRLQQERYTSNQDGNKGKR